MAEMRRKLHISACKVLNERDIYLLVNFFGLWLLFSFIFIIFCSEILAADPNNYHQEFSLSLEGIGFSEEEPGGEFDKKNMNNKKDENKRRDYDVSEEELPNLRKAYEKFDDYRQNLSKEEPLVCAKILKCMNPLSAGSKEKLPINLQDSRGKGKNAKFASESDEYYSLLRDELFQSEISAVLELAKEGKSQENDKQAFLNNEKRQLKRVTKTTRKLLEKYESLKQSMFQKYPRIVYNRFLSVEDF